MVQVQVNQDNMVSVIDVNHDKHKDILAAQIQAAHMQLNESQINTQVSAVQQLQQLQAQQVQQVLDNVMVNHPKQRVKLKQCGLILIGANGIIN